MSDRVKRVVPLGSEDRHRVPLSSRLKDQTVPFWPKATGDSSGTEVSHLG